MARPRPEVPLYFKRGLLAISRDLSLEWNPAWGIWEIWYKSPISGRKTLALKVGDGYNYEPLSDRVLETLKAGDTHRIGLKAVMDILDAEERAYKEAQEREIDRVQEQFSKDRDKMDVLVQKPIGIPTSSEYQKPKGKVF